MNQPTPEEKKAVAIPPAHEESLKNFLALADDPNKVFGYDELLGFLFGLAITPEAVSPREWLPAIFEGAMPEFPAKEQAQKMMTALTETLHAYLMLAKKHQLYFPFDPFTASDQEIHAMMSWLLGLNQALLLRPAIWAPEASNLDHETFERVHFSMSILEGIVNPDSAKRFGEKISDEILRGVFPQYSSEDGNRDQAVSGFLISSAPMAVNYLAGYSQRRNNPAEQERNDLCACGSGKKYKKCCGNTQAQTPVSPVH